MIIKMEENGRIEIEDSFDFERNATKAFAYIFIGIIIIGGVYWIIIYPLLVKVLTLLIFPVICYVIWYIFKRIREAWFNDCSFILTDQGFEIYGHKNKYIFNWKELTNIKVTYKIITYRDPDTSDTHKYILEVKDKLETHIVELKDTVFHIEKIRLFLYHLQIYASQMGISFTRP